jgi:MerR family transcriptional regulator, light-induced transcriptional regulator
MSRVTTGQGSADKGDAPPEVVASPGGDHSGEQPRLTVAAVARRLGIAPGTLRTWDRRYGIGPTGHTSGHHRRYGPDDIARLEQMQQALLRGASPAEAARYARSFTAPARQHQDVVQDVRAPAPPALSSGVLTTDVEVIDVSTHTGGRGLKLSGADPRARGLGRAALALDSESAQHLLIESMATDGVLLTWQAVLQPVLAALVERRQRTGVGIEAQQLLVDCSSTALRATMAKAAPALSPRPVLLVPAPGEGQELELVVLAAALAGHRVGYRLFGPSLPKEGLDRVVRQIAPAAVVVWSQQPHYASRRLFSNLTHRRQRVRLFAIGAGWSADDLPGHVEQLGSLDSAVERVEAVAQGRV